MYHYIIQDCAVFCNPKYANFGKKIWKEKTRFSEAETRVV